MSRRIFPRGNKPRNQRLKADVVIKNKSVVRRIRFMRAYTFSSDSLLGAVRKMNDWLEGASGKKEIEIVNNNLTIYTDFSGLQKFVLVVTYKCFSL